MNRREACKTAVAALTGVVVTTSPQTEQPAESGFGVVSWAYLPTNRIRMVPVMSEDDIAAEYERGPRFAFIRGDELFHLADSGAKVTAEPYKDDDGTIWREMFHPALPRTALDQWTPVVNRHLQRLPLSPRRIFEMTRLPGIGGWETKHLIRMIPDNAVQNC